MRIDTIPTPSYVIDEEKLEHNCKVLREVMDRTGCKILLAQKAFSAFYYYPMIGKYLSGTTASGLYEAKLGRSKMGGDTHIFSPAYRDREFEEITKLCDHIVFNSITQYEKFAGRSAGCSVGLRINPECSTQDHGIYDPCAPGSRLGVTAEKLIKALESGLDISTLEGLHFHTLCEQDSDALESTLTAVEEKFADLLQHVKWVNFGGGHHITRADYDIDRLCRLIEQIQRRYDVEVYLEPGEAVALNAGYLVTEVMELVENANITTAILDASAACHMPDVLEMPYRPPLRASAMPQEKKYTYRLSSCTCLAGDIIGDYSFDTALQIGDKLIFEDMAIYSMVKNNTFNGMALPSIYGMDKDGNCHLIKEFDYEDFKGRLS